MKTKLLLLFALSNFYLIKAQQMSGSYTLDSSSTATSTNFKTWNSFANALQGNARDDGGSNFAGGISASVTLTVSSNLYISKSIQIGQIAGASSSKTITINGNSKTVVLTSSSNQNFVLDLIGVDYLTLKNLTLVQSKNANKIGCLRFSNNSDNNLISNCKFQFSTSSAIEAAYIAFSRNVSSPYDTGAYGNNGKNNIIENCTLTTSASNASGPYYGIFESQNPSNYATTAINNIFRNNQIENFYKNGIWVQFTNGVQVLGNTINRKAAGTSIMNKSGSGISISDCYATSQVVKLSRNTIQDLPLKTANSTNSGVDIEPIQIDNVVGSNSLRSQVFSNKISNINSSIGLTGMRITASYTDIDTNSIEKCNTFSSANMITMNVDGANNSIRKNTITSNFIDGDFGGISCHSNSIGGNVCNENVIQNNKLNGNGNNTLILFLLGNSNNSSLYSNWIVQRNKILGNDNDSINTQGAFCGFYIEDRVGVDLGSNLIAQNTMASDIAGVFGTSNDTAAKVRIHHNTFHFDNINSSWTGSEFSRAVEIRSYGEFYMIGNVFSMENMAQAAGVIYDGSGSDYEINQNSYYSNNISFSKEWVFQGNYFYTLSDWKNSGYSGNEELEMNPEFKNSSALEYESKNILNQNNVPYTSKFSLDILGKQRNKSFADRGAYETKFDPSITLIPLTVKDTTCAGALVQLSVKIKNNFEDTIQKLYLNYQINAATIIKDSTKKNILPGDSLVFVFGKDIKLFTGMGTAKIKAYIVNRNDDLSNDTIKKTLFVKPSPTGSKYQAATYMPSKAKYFAGIPVAVSTVGQPIYLDITSPTAYVFSQYNTAWLATTTAYSASGRILSGISVTPPPTGYLIKFNTTDTNLQDSLIRICTTIKDIGNKCDTTLCTTVKIAASPKAAFTVPAVVCDGDTVSFNNISKIKAGGMNYTFHFGTAAKDSSNSNSPKFKFPGTGTYTVKLIATSLPYGFTDTFVKTIIVNPKPTVSFTRTNVCEGNKNIFTNTSTPLTATYTWTKDNVTFTNPISAAWTEGTYQVKLTGNLNGCISSSTLKTFVFPKPFAAIQKDFGNCSTDTFMFTDITTLKSGTWGRIWDFNEGGNKSGVISPKYRFNSGGNKPVKLVITSDLGCKDSIIKSFTIKQGPAIAFTASRYCSRSASVFKNTTPVVSGTNASYSWSFGDGGTSVSENPSHSWTNIGSKTIKFKVSLDNGCAAEISRNVDVLAQPTADFTIPSICIASPAQFLNKTNWTQGNLDWYYWDFASYVDSSSKTNPTVTFANPGNASISVRLIAKLVGGCTDTITKLVYINDLPKTCDFELGTAYDYAYYGLQATPKTTAGALGAQSGVNYTWKLGTLQPVALNGTYKVALPGDGNYCVTMVATTTANCNCTKTNCFNMNRASIAAIEKTGISIYPNPTNNKVQIALPATVGKVNQIELLSLNGTVLSQTKGINAGIQETSLSDLARGVYLIKVTCEGKVWMGKVVKQ